MKEIWIPLLEAAEVVANPYYVHDEEFKLRVQKSFVDLRKEIADARKHIEEGLSTVPFGTFNRQKGRRLGDSENTRAGVARCGSS